MHCRPSTGSLSWEPSKQACHSSQLFYNLSFSIVIEFAKESRPRREVLVQSPVCIGLRLINNAVLPVPVALLASESLSLEYLVIRAGRYAIFGRYKVLSSRRDLSRDASGRLDQRP